jgi:hypothetical protein
MTMKETAIQQPLLSSSFTNKHVCMATIQNSNRGMVFFVWSMLRCYKQDSWSNELIVRWSPAGKNMSMEAEDIVGIRHQAIAGENYKLRRLYVCCGYSDL